MCLKRKRHQHIIFPEVEQVSICLEKCKEKCNPTDHQRTHHRCGADQPVGSISHTHRDAVRHQHDVQKARTDHAPDDLSFFLFVGAIPIDISLTGRQQ